ncbi:MAG: hypothetical protein IT331_02425 [Anaerolineae bacterium]|nr:hypothetical protein [Anaerolineae bacterium]
MPPGYSKDYSTSPARRQGKNDYTTSCGVLVRCGPLERDAGGRLVFY